MHRVLMPGGMWGFKLSIDTNLSSKLFELITNANNSRVSGKARKKFGDQRFLSSCIYSFASKSAFVHDSFLCKTYTNSRPWPTKRIGNCFVGCVHCDCDSRAKDNQTFTHICPLECRPKKHIDWIYC